MTSCVTRAKPRRRMSVPRRLPPYEHLLALRKKSITNERRRFFIKSRDNLQKSQTHNNKAPFPTCLYATALRDPSLSRLLRLRLSATLLHLTPADPSPTLPTPAAADGGSALHLSKQRGQRRDAQARREDEGVLKQWRQIFRLSNVQRVKPEHAHPRDPDGRGYTKTRAAAFVLSLMVFYIVVVWVCHAIIGSNKHPADILRSSFIGST